MTEEQRQKALARSRAWHFSHLEHRRTLRRKSYLAKKEKIQAQNKAWRLANREKSAGYTKRWQAKNPEKTKAIYKNWVRNNPDTRRVTKKQSNHKRKSILRSVHYEDCTAKIALLQKERFCRWCCTPLTNKNRTVDHIIPLARGGHHIPDNLAAACRTCNFSRNDKLIHEWLPLQEFAA